MAEKVAEDDDDEESFGDFTFVPYAIHTSQSDPMDGDEDEWGDFINHPCPNQFPNGHLSSALLCNPDTFTGIGRFSPEEFELQKSTWVKPRGTLPLSIFGDDDVVEDGFGDVNSNIDDVISPIHNHVDISKIESSRIKVGVNINEAITDLYNQMEQIKSPSEPYSSSNHVESSSCLKGFNSSAKNSNFIFNGLDSSPVHPIANGVDSAMNGLNSEFVDVDEDDKSWEFMGAGLEKDDENLNFKGPDALESLDWKVESAFVKENRAGNIGCSGNTADGSMMKMPYTKTTDIAEVGLESLALDECFDVEDNVWEFKDASSKALKKHEDTYSEISEYEDIWDFKEAHLDSTSEDAGDSEAADHSLGGIVSSTSCNKIPENIMTLEHQKEELSFFYGNGMPNADVPIDPHDIFINNNPTSYTANNVLKQSSCLPINDRILNLYSEASQNHHILESPQNLSEDGHDLSEKTFISDFVKDGDDDFSNDSWEFKDLFSESMVEDMNTISFQAIGKKSSNTTELDSFMDFYVKLKEKLCIVALCHLDSLKNAAISNEGTRTVPFDEEYQESYKDIQQCCAIPDEASLHVDVDEFHKILHQPNYHLINSEFYLTQKLLLAEKELKPAIELLKHAASMLNILKLGSEERQAAYVSAWLDLISACAKELKHGALIWKRSLQKNAEFLCERRGQKFILELGEIYRVVEVIGASARLYKPWIFIYSTDFKEIIGLVEECWTVWSSSGLGDALAEVVMYNDETSLKEALLGSILYIHSLDASSLQNLVFFPKDQLMCKFSLLTPGALPGMKMVCWNDEQYFVKVANAWANLVTCDPPKLDQVK